MSNNIYQILPQHSIIISRFNITQLNRYLFARVLHYTTQQTNKTKQNKTKHSLTHGHTHKHANMQTQNAKKNNFISIVKITVTIAIIYNTLHKM